MLARLSPSFEFGRVLLFLRWPLVFLSLLMVVGSNGHLRSASVKSSPRATHPGDPAAVGKSYGKLPMGFEANVGQTDTTVKFLSRGNGYTVFLTSTESVFSLTTAPQHADGMGTLTQRVSEIPKTAAAGQNAVLRLTLGGSEPPTKITGLESQLGKSNYFRGNDPNQWRTNIPTYGSVMYTDVYPGIDLVYHSSTERQLEYDFRLAPGTDPSVIRIRFAGADDIRLDANGDLVMRVGNGTIRQHEPDVYQDVGAIRRQVAAEYVLGESKEIGFIVGEHDSQSVLVIDPVLLYSTYLGGSDVPFGVNAIAVDSTGAAYVAGDTTSTEFPTTPGAFRRTNNGGTPLTCVNCDSFVTKFDASGSIVYSTYFGGHGTNSIVGIAVDAFGAAYVIGSTLATDFPTTPGAFQPGCTRFNPGVPLAGACNVGFVSKLNASGSDLIFSTYLGGDGVNVTGYGTYPSGLVLDENSNVFIAGSTSPNFPLTPGVFQPEYLGTYITGFVTKMNSTGTGLIYSSYLGGHFADTAARIGIDAVGNAYITGLVRSPDFPTTPGAFQRTCPILEVVGGCSIAFVTKIDTTGSSILYSTFLGGHGPGIAAINGVSSEGTGIAVDRDGFAYVTGQSYTTDFPTTSGSLKPTTTSRDAFVSKLNHDGTGLVYSTNLGGNSGDFAAGGGFEEGHGIAIDAAGNAYVVGSTGASDFPVVNPVQSEFAQGVRDVYVAKLNPAGSALTFSTYLGGGGYDQGYAIAVDGIGNIYVAGTTSSPDFPTVNAFQPGLVGLTSSFVAKIEEFNEPSCGVDITDQVDVFRTPFHRILFTPFRFQWVIIRNKSAEPIAGPLAFVMDDLQKAVFIGSSFKTTCFSPEGDPFMLVETGSDNILSPNESTLTGLWFFKTSFGRITYTPHVLSRIPTQ